MIDIRHVCLQERNRGARKKPCQDWAHKDRSLVARIILQFWPVPPSSDTSLNVWRDTHPGATESAIDALCKKSIPLIGELRHPREHDVTILKESIVAQMQLHNFTFPMTWKQTQRVVFKTGPCRGCGAGVLVDGQWVQGKYDGKRLPIKPDFKSKHGKQLKTCRFCTTAEHPIKLERKRRRKEDNKELERTLMGYNNVNSGSIEIECETRIREDIASSSRRCTNTHSLTHKCHMHLLLDDRSLKRRKPVYPDIDWSSPPNEIDQLLVNQFRHICRQTIGIRFARLCMCMRIRLCIPIGFIHTHTYKFCIVILGHGT